MYEATIKFGNTTIKTTADDLKMLFRQAAPLNQLPTHCPIDGTPAVLGHRTTTAGDEYFELWSTGDTQFKYNIGQAKKDDALFPKHTWTHYDPATDKETILWQHGQLTPAGKALVAKKKPQPTQQPPARVEQAPTIPSQPTEPRVQEQQLDVETVEALELALELAYPDADKREDVKQQNLERLGVSEIANITPGQAQTWGDFLAAKASQPTQEPAAA